MACSIALYMSICSILPKVDYDNISHSFIALFVQFISNLYLCNIHKLYKAMHVATKLGSKHSGTSILLRKIRHFSFKVFSRAFGY